MGYKFFADGDDNGLIRIDDATGAGEQYQPTLDRWKANPGAAGKARLSGEYEPVSEKQARIVGEKMRDRFAPAP